MHGVRLAAGRDQCNYRCSIVRTKMQSLYCLLLGKAAAIPERRHVNDGVGINGYRAVQFLLWTLHGRQLS